MITNAEARILLRKKLAVIHKIYPFTIRLRDNSCVSQDRAYTVKIDPGSKHTGIAITDDTNQVVMLAEIEHRGSVVKNNVSQMSSETKLYGADYQQGPLYQKKLRDFIFSRSNGKCSYCGAKAEEIDHIIPRSSGETNSTYNLVAACKSCNQMKSNLSLKEFGKLVGKDFSKIKAKALPKDAAIVQSARNYMAREISKFVADTTTHDAWLTKYNRNELGLSKEHYYDALSVGNLQDYKFLTDKVLQISAKGRGSRQMCRVDRYGFPRTSAKASKSVRGFQTGDIVKAIVPSGFKKRGEYLGRVIVRSNGGFNIETNEETTQGIGYKYCRLIQRGDGYSYKYKERNRVSVAKI